MLDRTPPSLITPEDPRGDLLPFESSDPETWGIDWNAPAPERHIYPSNSEHFFVLVDEEFYHYAIHWRWNCFLTKAWKTYFRRSRETARTEVGVRGKVETLLLHRAVMEFYGIAPEHPDQRVVDHIDGNEFDCRKANLRWATYLVNTLNRR